MVCLRSAEKSDVSATSEHHFKPRIHGAPCDRAREVLWWHVVDDDSLFALRRDRRLLLGMAVPTHWIDLAVVDWTRNRGRRRLRRRIPNGVFGLTT